MNGAELTIREERDGEACRLVVAGDVDLLSAPAIEDAVGRALAQNGTTTIVIDLRQVTFMDSSGLRALLGANGKAEAARAQLALSIAPGPVEKLLSLAGVREWFRYA